MTPIFSFLPWASAGENTDAPETATATSNTHASLSRFWSIIFLRGATPAFFRRVIMGYLAPRVHASHVQTSRLAPAPHVRAGGLAPPAHAAIRSWPPGGHHT